MARWSVYPSADLPRSRCLYEGAICSVSLAILLSVSVLPEIIFVCAPWNPFSRALVGYRSTIALPCQSSPWTDTSQGSVFSKL